MDGPEVWVASEEGTGIIRARDISAVGLDEDGNVTARLAGREGPIVALAARRAHHGERQPGGLHRQLIRVIAQLSDSSGAHLVRPVHAGPGGWRWATGPL